MKERKQDRARFWKGIRMVWRMDRGLIVHSVLRALLQAAIPYVGILLSAYVLTACRPGCGLKSFCRRLRLPWRLRFFFPARRPMSRRRSPYMRIEAEKHMIPLSA